MKTAYNLALHPPAPFLTVRLHDPTTDVMLTLPAKVDTGADVSAVPVTMVEQLHLASAGEFVVEAFDGARTRMTAYDIALDAAQLHLTGIPAITFAEEYVLLGRDVLNALRLLLDGPALSVEILP
jgi:hypothetical protein